MLEPRGIPTKQGLICVGFLACQQSKFLHERSERYVHKTRFIMYEVSGMNADTANMALIAILSRLRTLQTALSRQCGALTSADFLHIMQEYCRKPPRNGFASPRAHPCFKDSLLMACLKKPYISGIFSFEIRHVRYMPIDVGTAHNHTAAVGKPSILIALISDIANPAPPPAILMSDVRNVSGRCANCCHLRRNRAGFSCRIPYTSHAPNIYLSSLKKTAICTCIC